MAQISFSGNWGHSLYFETSYAQNIKNNTTTYYINNIQIGGGWEINFNVGQYVTFNINNEPKTVYIDRLDLSRNGWKKLGSLSWTIPHNQDGSVSVSLGIYCDLSSISYGKYSFGGIYNDWQDLYIPRILRGAELTSTIPTELSTSNATFNATCTIHNSSFKTIMELSYTNPKTNDYEWLGVTYEDKSSATFTISRNHLDKLVGLFTNQSYANITFTLVSRDRNTNENISSIQKIIKLNFGSEYNPVINSFNLEERKQEIKALVLPQQNYVQDLSLIVPILSTQAKMNATIENYEISYNDIKLNSNNGAFTLKMTANGKISISLKVTDSRGKQAIANQEITLLSYHAPRITAFDVQRDTRNQEKVNVSFQTAYANILGKNNYSILIQYSEKGKNTWNTAYSISNQYSVEKREDKYMLPITCKNISSYDFKMTITDKFTHSVYLDNLGMAIKPLVLIPQGGVFGGMPTNKKLRGLQVHGILVDGNEYRYLQPLVENNPWINTSLTKYIDDHPDIFYNGAIKNIKIRSSALPDKYSNGFDWAQGIVICNNSEREVIIHQNKGDKILRISKSAGSWGVWTVIGNNAYIFTDGGIDFNLYWRNGIWNIDSNAKMTQSKNKPTDYAGFLTVKNSTMDTKQITSWMYVVQEFKTYLGDLYIRRGETNETTTIKWYPWKKVY